MIKVLSDLHGEIYSHLPPYAEDIGPDGDIVVFAGDTHTCHLAIEYALSLAPPKAHIVLVAGNHEHYKSRLPIDDGIAVMKQMAAQYDTPKRRVVVLENDTAVISVRGEEVRFLGATLWTNYALFGSQLHHAHLCGQAINDHRMILGKDRASLFTTEEACNRHAESVAFLREQLAIPYPGPTVVVTHHGVSIRSVASKWVTDPISAAFSSNLDDILSLGAATLWIHGHTHDSMYYQDPSGTLVVCNPAGYARHLGLFRENSKFNPRMMVRLLGSKNAGWTAT